MVTPTPHLTVNSRNTSNHGDEFAVKTTPEDFVVLPSVNTHISFYKVIKSGLTLIVPRALGDRLYATLHKMPEELDNSFCLFFEVVKLSPIHIWKPLHTFHSKIKAFTSEPLPYLLQAVTKISTLYNFYEWRV